MLLHCAPVSSMQFLSGFQYLYVEKIFQQITPQWSEDPWFTGSEIQLVLSTPLRALLHWFLQLAYPCLSHHCFPVPVDDYWGLSSARWPLTWTARCTHGICTEDDERMMMTGAWSCYKMLWICYEYRWIQNDESSLMHPILPLWGIRKTRITRESRSHWLCHICIKHHKTTRPKGMEHLHLCWESS